MAMVSKILTVSFHYITSITDMQERIELVKSAQAPLIRFEFFAVPGQLG